MSLPPVIPFYDLHMAEGTSSIATTPVPAVLVASCSGYIRRLYAAAGGTTTGTITVAVTINGVATDIAGGALTIAAGTGARNNPGVSLPHVGANMAHVNEGDIITFTPSGGTGSNIPGAFTAVIRPNK